MGKLSNPLLTEASGLTASRRSDAVLWAVNDSGNDPLVFAFDKEGNDLGTVRIAGVPNLDWEDIAGFEYHGKPYLLIADTGDNRGARRTSYLHIIEEPAVEKLSPKKVLMVNRSWTVAFRFEDGPRDCEAVAVLPGSEEILLISKRDVPAGLYTLPLMPSDTKQVQVARKVGSLDQIPQPKGAGALLRKNGRYAAQPTAVDIAADGSGVAMLTYVAVYYWPVASGKRIAAAMAKEPERISLPYIQQAEGVCFSRDGNSLVVASESRREPLYQLRRSAAAPQ